ncbi:MAG: hypothetical protein SGJ20_15630, partial [Planctomycetota bacterium]|nr:hypothetical protein [Planctomycetota bacterium]
CKPQAAPELKSRMLLAWTGVVQGRLFYARAFIWFSEFYTGNDFSAGLFQHFFRGFTCSNGRRRGIPLF